MPNEFDANVMVLLWFITKKAEVIWMNCFKGAHTAREGLCICMQMYFEYRMVQEPIMTVIMSDASFYSVFMLI